MKVYAHRGASSFLIELIPIGKGSNNENSVVSSPHQRDWSELFNLQPFVAVGIVEHHISTSLYPAHLPHLMVVNGGHLDCGTRPGNTCVYQNYFKRIAIL